MRTINTAPDLQQLGKWQTALVARCDQTFNTGTATNLRRRDISPWAIAMLVFAGAAGAAFAANDNDCGRSAAKHTTIRFTQMFEVEVEVAPQLPAAR